MKQFLVMGAGAIGGTLAAHIAEGEAEVALIEKDNAHRKAIAAQGLLFHGPTGARRMRLRVEADARDLRDFAPDVALLTVKSYHTEAALAELCDAFGASLPIACAQNGVRNEELAARSFRQVLGVCLLFSARRDGDGEIRQTAAGSLLVGDWPRGAGAATELLAAAFGQRGLNALATPRIAAHKWNKLIVNLNNATLGVTGFSGEEARADTATRSFMAAVYAEGVAVLRAAGIPFEGVDGLPSFDARIAEYRRPVEPAPLPPETERQRASLWQDLARGIGATEADALNGEIVLLGARHGVPAPRNALLLRLAEAMAARRAQPGGHAAAELEAMALA
jgi:2-dehydropantoate 2-reductase